MGKSDCDIAEKPHTISCMVSQEEKSHRLESHFGEKLRVSQKNITQMDISHCEEERGMFVCLFLTYERLQGLYLYQGCTEPFFDRVLSLPSLVCRDGRDLFLGVGSNIGTSGATTFSLLSADKGIASSSFVSRWTAKLHPPILVGQ